MAYTKIFAIRRRLDKTVAYAINPEKTEMEDKIAYVVDGEKTKQLAFTTVLNCGSIETAYQKMEATKKRWDKTDGVLGYHLIQSFAPGEVTPEDAHKIGVEFAKKLFGEFEVVVGTHLDQAHIHNHIVLNAVSFQNGRRYHSSPASYYDEIRAASDDLCREHHLSVITPQGHGKPYAEWKAEKEGKPTVRSMIRADIDSVINDAYNFETFLLLLEKRGYEIKHSPKRKYTTVKPPGAKRAIRLDSLGYGYTEAEIKEKTKVNRQKQSVSVEIGQVKQKKYYRIGRGDRYRPKKKLTGFLALYFRYVYLLRRSKSKPMTSYRIKKEVTKLERYQKQFCYLLKSDIHSTKQLEETMKALEWEILQAEQNRKPLYRKQRTAEDGDEKQALLGEISQYTSVLREKRRELALCRRIYKTIPQVTEQYRQAQTELQQKMQKEGKQYEYQRGSR